MGARQRERQLAAPYLLGIAALLTLQHLQRRGFRFQDTLKTDTQAVTRKCQSARHSRPADTARTQCSMQVGHSIVT